LAAIEKVTNQVMLVDVAKNASDSDVRIAAARKLVELDLEEDLLTALIRMLGNALKDSENEGTTRNAANTLLAFYRRYGTSKHGPEIRRYEGRYSGGHSRDHTDVTTYTEVCSNESGLSGCFFNKESHTDSHHHDTTFSIEFNP
jgi:hypothetical protein